MNPSENGTKPSLTEKIKIQRSTLDSNLDDVTAVKFVDFTEPSDLQTAIDLAGENHLAALAEGLRVLKMREASKSSEGFFLVDEDGKVTETPLTGAVLSEDQVKRVQVQILTFAKMAAEADGKTWDKAMPVEEKRAFKESAKEAMKSSPAIMKMVSGLRPA